MWKSAIGIVLVAVASAGCGGDGSVGGNMMGPSSASQASMMGGGPSTWIVGMSPAGGSSGVGTSGSIEIRFSAAMPAGSGFQVDLHLGDLSGSTVALACVAAADRTGLTCKPATPLQPGTRYVTHVGGGMTAGNGSCGSGSSMMGGLWIGAGGMSAATHGGMSWGSMGGWGDACGGYGMAFPFTTA